jgi:hypothetical protein
MLKPPGTIKSVVRSTLSSIKEKRGHWYWLTSLFLIGLAAKLRLINDFSTAFPYWDQWGAEAAYLYIPLFDGELTWQHFFWAHNEHRILFTRLYDLALLWLNGQWDSQVQMVGSAIIHAGALSGLARLLAHLLGARYWPWIWGSQLAAMVFPFAWENTLAGFQSQFYFLLISAVLALWLLGTRSAYSVSWWIGAFALIAGLFTGASGVFTSGGSGLRFDGAQGVAAAEGVERVPARLPVRVRRDSHRLTDSG